MAFTPVAHDYSHMESDGDLLGLYRTNAEALGRREFDLVILLTGVGTTALLDAIAAHQPLDPVLATLRQTRLAVRGPKPAAALRTLDIRPWLVAPEPNTWRELLAEHAAPPGGRS